MRRTVIVVALAAIAGGAELSAPQMTVEEVSAFQAVMQEQRVAQAELRAAQERTERLNEIGLRLTMQVCANRGITAKDVGELGKVCHVDLEKRTITRVAPPAAVSKVPGQ